MLTPLTAPENTPTEVLKLSSAEDAAEEVMLPACAGRPMHHTPNEAKKAATSSALASRWVLGWLGDPWDLRER